jgi:hypothetical protein
LPPVTGNHLNPILSPGTPCANIESLHFQEFKLQDSTVCDRAGNEAGSNCRFHRPQGCPHFERVRHIGLAGAGPRPRCTGLHAVKDAGLEGDWLCR